MVCNGRLRGAMQLGMAALQHEAGAAVLQHDPGIARDHAAAERVIQAVDERHGVAVAVHHAEIHGVAVRARRRGKGKRAACFGSMRAYCLAANAFDNIRFHGQRVECRVGDVFIALGRGQLEGLDEQMQMIGAQVRPCRAGPPAPKY